MKKFKNLSRRALAALLAMLVLLMTLPIISATADSSTKVSDPSTMDGWKSFFGKDVMNTENAGGVWTDKSVFTDASAFSDMGITMDSADDSFLVALSAIASNKTVTGSANVPTDTMLVLDVSGSMNNNNGNNDVAEELVQAANESIHELLTSNENNRVGVVLYSGPAYANDPASSTDAVLLLPLGRYTTASDNKYISYSTDDGDEFVSVDTDTLIAGGTAKPTSVSKWVLGATYIQKGVILAMNQFTDEGNSTTVTVNGAQVKRKPVMVLMSDGEPTVASTNFTAPSSYNLGSGQTGSSDAAAMGFATQLSAAYAKQQIETKYGTDCLFYTLGLGVGNNAVATSVLDPEESTTAINNFWSSYNAAEVGGTVAVKTEYFLFWSNTISVTKISQPLEQNYVDRYFPVSSDAEGGLAGGLKQAFKDIVGTIQLQSRYFPTLISDNEDLSGYVTFVDRIGEYMEVTDVKGVLIHNTLFSGADLASNFVSGGGELGTTDNPTELGDEMVHAVQQRLGIADIDTARTLIGLAYEHGQLSYTSDTEFSNYIGWYANAAGEFLGFWHEGIETMPDPADPTLTDETRPAFIIKSYGYLGEVDEAHGVTESDMMYATIQVRENITTGEQLVTFAVPAALIPIVTYNVTLDSSKKLTDLTVSGAEHPIRLVYEVSLKDGINEYTVSDTDVVSADYAAANTDSDGNISFYTNKYQVDNTTGYGKVNTYSYFTPSRQNDKYYFTVDTPIYADDNGTAYTGDAIDVNGTYYNAYTVYAKNGSLETRTVYRQFSSEVLATAKRNQDGTWFIPAGDIHVNLSGYTVYKGGINEANYSASDPDDTAKNVTGTLVYANQPFVDAQNHTVDDSGYNFYVGATLGNNGKLTITPATGIKLTKTVNSTAADAETAEFEFTVSNITNTNDSSNYDALKIAADGTQTETTVDFSGGKATVTLKSGETLYIGGMTAGDKFTVTEAQTENYAVASVNGDTSKISAELTVEANKLSPVDFVNTDKGKGNLTVAKQITHDFGTDYTIPNKEFKITVTLKGFGVANKTYEAKHTSGEITSVTTDSNGSFEVTLQHREQVEIFGLPEGTVATVAEQNPDKGFTASYSEDGQAGDGAVTIRNNMTSTVEVVNDYTPEGIPSPVKINVSGTKTLTGREWKNDDTFTFELQKYDSEADAWIEASPLATATVKGSDSDKDFDFTGAFENESYSAAGTYYYRVVEIQPETGALGGVSYDKTVHSFGVVVADSDMDGYLEIADVVAYRDTTTVTDTTGTDGYWNVGADFTNTYSTTGSNTVTIDLNKAVTNESGSPLPSLAGFKFGLYDEDGKLLYTSAETTDRGFARLVLPAYTEAGTYEYTLKEIIPESVPHGWNYSKEEISVTVKVTDGGDGYLDAVIYTGSSSQGAGASTSATFTNVYNPDDATLGIDFVKKSLSGRALADGEFTFELRETDGTPLLYGKNTAGGEVNFYTSTDYTDIGSLTFDKVGDYYYNVVETSADGKGVATDKTVHIVHVTVTDTNGKLSASYGVHTVVGDIITFENTYTPAETKYSVEGTKALTGRVLLNDEFEFVLTEANADGTAKDGGATLKARNYADGTFAFEAVTYTKADTYYYIVSETKSSGSDHGIIYDETKFLVTVTVSDDGEGKLYVDKASGVTYAVIKDGDDEAASAVKFTNKYVPAATYSTLSGEKFLNGKTLENEQFSFALYESDESWKKGDPIETVKNDENGDFGFTKIDFDKADTYYYIVKEVIPDDAVNNVKDGIIYDATEYRVTVNVVDNLLGQLIASVSITDQAGIPHEGIVFNNAYEVTGSAKVSLSGKKTLTSYDDRKMTDGQFTFELYKTDDTYAVAEGAVPVETTASYADGSFRFKDRVYDEAVTEYYVIREQIPDGAVNNVKDGITYDSAEYRVKIEVTDDDNGNWEEKTTITDKDGNEAEVEFANSYAISNVQYTFSGEKLYNKLMNGGEFTFVLYETGENHQITASTKSYTETNGADGSFTFDTFTFTEPKKAYYVLKESVPAGAVNGVLNGIKYDETVYEITLNVRDNGRGKLVVDTVITPNVDVTVTSTNAHFKFSNTYTAAPVGYTLKGEKAYNGTNNKEFTFDLYKTDSSYDISKGTLVETKTTAGSGAFLFNALNYTVAATEYYVIAERVPENAVNNVYEGITYDAQLRKIKITVTDNGFGELVADAQIEGGTATENATANTVTAKFTNTYSAANAEYTVKGEKTYKKGFGHKKFTFELYETDSTFNTNGVTPETVQNGNDGRFSFDKMTFNTAGTKYYVIKEQIPDEAKADNNEYKGIKYDDTEYKLTVEITDDGKGQLKAKATVTPDANKDDVSATVTFTNVYTAKSAEYVIKGEKTYKKGFDHKKFTFELYETDSTYSITGKTPKTVQNGNNGKFSFEGFTFGEETTKYYVVKEQIPANAVNNIYEGITYDSTKYSIKLEVKDNDEGQLIVVPTVTPTATANGTSTTVKFENKYTAKSADYVIAGKKTYNKALEGNDFTFELYETGSDFEIAKNAQPYSTAKNGANGYFEFAKVSFEKEETRYFVVKEQIPADAEDNVKDGIKYDTTEYRITLKAEDNGKGQIVVTPTVDAKVIANGEKATVTFENSYTAKKAEYAIVGNKSYTKTLEGDEFTFELYETGSDFEIAKNAQPYSTAKNGANGYFEFAKVSFEKEETRYFVVKEQIPADAEDNVKDGIKYDTAEYRITLKAEDNGKGQIVVTPTVDTAVTADGEKATVSFSNSYSASAAVTEIKGTKKLANRTLKDGEFEFMLYSTGADFKIPEGADAVTVKNAADGSFVFTDLTFTAEDVYYFVIVEKKGTDETVTYDETVYGVTVTVTDNGKGLLEVTDTVMGKIGSETFTESDIVFNNTYNAPVEPDPDDTNPDTPSNPTTPGTPGSSTTPESSDDSSVPKTGDNRNIALWLALLFVSSVTFVGAGAYSRKRSRKE